MNGYEEKSHLNEDDFAAKGSIVSAFDAFRTSPSIMFSVARNSTQRD